MKLITILVVLSMLLTFAGATSAAPLSSSALTLVSATAGMNGTVFIFNVSGEFSKSELKGAVHVEGGDDYVIHCNQVDDETVRCTAPFKVQGNVVVTFGGSTFWTYIKPFTKYCYTVYDWNPPPPPFVDWVVAGTYCQRVPAESGQELLNWYNPAWGAAFDYVFLPESPTPCSFLTSPTLVQEDAFYFTFC